MLIDLNISHTEVDRAYSQKRASVSDDEPVVRGGGMNGGFQSNKEPAIIAAPAWKAGLWHSSPCTVNFRLHLHQKNLR